MTLLLTAVLLWIWINQKAAAPAADACAVQQSIDIVCSKPAARRNCGAR